MLGLWLLATAAPLPGETGLTVSCHLHPPTPDRLPAPPATPRGTIGPFRDQGECEDVRARLFGTGGRCHCVPGFGRPRPAARGQQTPAPVLP